MPRPLFTPGKDPVKEAGWASGPLQVRKISPPPGFDPRTVQPVASLYTDYATRSTEHEELNEYIRRHHVRKPGII